MLYFCTFKAMGGWSLRRGTSILSKNEVSREDRYNRKLFLRLRHGQYLINPRLALRVEGEWRRIYSVLQPQRLSAELRDVFRLDDFVYDPNTKAEQAMTELRTLLKDLEAGQTPK
ncbi:hypothetical protein [Allochromatium tepidum]|uniref:Uncharacterized protein n=1 Tax=Allochromatium tepidum TaxID=553982 RepID=A0ABN6G9S3_9GAMM|nr:hypothetical protein [Allochromatium tepidum]BCU05844.1 hypothetical protein Atep_05210 [Allochromatium tepidum]